MERFSVSGNIVDIINRKIFSGTVHVENGKITEVVKDPTIQAKSYILPGFIDSHVHVESSMLIPSEFARLASVHGTVATVSDPHEIGNVLGLEGIRYMIENGKKVPFHFYFGAPSCVPATSFETSGANIGPQEIEKLLTQDGLKYLSEMMNFPGVLNKDPEVMEKIGITHRLNKPVDGHAPGLRGEQAKKYIEAGISTDHECFELDEALDKIKYGMKIIIREGSAAKNYEALHPLIKMYPDKVMFGSDDKHPHELVKGHINLLVKRSIGENRYDIYDVLRAASYNPVIHYQLDVGLLRENDSADFIVVDNLEDFTVLATYVKGIKIAEGGKTLIDRIEASTPNHFNAKEIKPSDIAVKATGFKIRVIQPTDGQLITKSAVMDAKIVDDHYVSDAKHDILKLVVINRYIEETPAIAFIQNFGLKRGAIASCIAHDSHNIIAVGATDKDICNAVNLLVKHKGGIAAVDGSESVVLPLPIAGIMTNEDGYVVADQYSTIDALAKSLGTRLSAPFMTLSFMALLVIPELKLSDKGLFDGKTFTFVPLAVP